MNTSPNQPAPQDDELDPRLLDEALGAGASPEDLEAKVLALTDPRLNALLDEALAPEAAPEQLADRILAATTPGSAAAQTEQNDAPAVLARIGVSPWRYAAAAVIALAAGGGLWWISQQPDTGSTQSGGTIADLTPDRPAGTPELPELDQELADEFDSADGLLFADAALPVQNTLETVAEDINDVTITRDTLWSDMDAYEQFLTEIETTPDIPAT